MPEEQIPDAMPYRPHRWDANDSVMAAGARGDYCTRLRRLKTLGYIEVTKSIDYGRTIYLSSAIGDRPVLGAVAEAWGNNGNN
jgi:hypothetical protein